MRYPAFVAFQHRNRSTDSGTTPIEVTDGTTETPEEALEEIWQLLRDQAGRECQSRRPVGPP
jgi:hypothetical protein